LTAYASPVSQENRTPRWRSCHHAGLGASLRRVVESMPDCQCAGVWRTGEEALAKVPAFRPDVVLMDIHLPGISGIETTARLKAEIPNLLVIMVRSIGITTKSSTL